MPTILAIETSTEIASAAILHGEQLLSAQSSGVQTHSQTLLPMVQNLLHQADLRLQDCQAIAFGAGPGSFTGVRTACGITQGLAFGLNLPVLPIHTLLAMAEAARLQTGATHVMPVLDARMGEVYWAEYEFDGTWRTVHEPALANPAALLFPAGVQACGNGLGLCSPAGGENNVTQYPANNPVASGAINGTDNVPVMADHRADHSAARNAAALIMPHAETIARLGRLALAAGQGLPAAQAQPLYLRNKVAQTTLERAQRGAAR